MKRTSATTSRVLNQLKHDHRSVALIIVLPSLLMWLFKYVFEGNEAMFIRLGPQLLGLFPVVIMFLLTSVTMVRERLSGTLERILTTPIGRGEFIAGYAIAFGLAALVQSLVTSSVAIWLLDLSVKTPWVVITFAVVNAILGSSLGLLTSAFARSEFQALQFMPLFIIPQLLLGGLLAPRDQMADVLYAISHFLPLSYTIDAFNHASAVSGWDSEFTKYLLISVGFIVASILLAALTMQRRTR